MQLLQYNCIQYFQVLNELNSFQAKVQNFKRKAVNILESNISGISHDCNASEGVKDLLSASRFAQILAQVRQAHITIEG